MIIKTKTSTYVIDSAYELEAVLNKVAEGEANEILNQILTEHPDFIDNKYNCFSTLCISLNNVKNISLLRPLVSFYFYRAMHHPEYKCHVYSLKAGFAGHPQAIIDIIMPFVLYDQTRFKSIFENTQYALKEIFNMLPTFWIKETIRMFDVCYANSSLHIALKDCPILFEKLLEHGADVDRVNQQGLTPLGVILTVPVVDWQKVMLLLSRGANPNSLNASQHGCLHRLITDTNSHYKPPVIQLLRLGCNPTLSPPATNVSALALLYTTVLSTHESFDVGAALIQHGADADTYDSVGMNFFNKIYSTFPRTLKFVKKHVAENDLYKPKVVISMIGISRLRLTFRCLDEEFAARNSYLNFVIRLACLCASPENNLLKSLPSDVLVLINAYVHGLVQWGEFNTTKEAAMQLCKAAIVQQSHIRAMLKTPGGVNALQKTKEVIFFKSARTLCKEYDDKRIALKHKESYMKPHMNDKSFQELQKKHEEELGKFKDSYASACLLQNLSIFSTAVNREKLQDQIAQSHLYCGTQLRKST